MARPPPYSNVYLDISKVSVNLNLKTMTKETKNGIEIKLTNETIFMFNADEDNKNEVLVTINDGTYSYLSQSQLKQTIKFLQAQVR